MKIFFTIHAIVWILVSLAILIPMHGILGIGINDSFTFSFLISSFFIMLPTSAFIGLTIFYVKSKFSINIKSKG